MPSKKSRKNIYTHSIQLEVLNLKNSNKEEFRSALEALPYKGYEVEQIADGRKIVITKPGGKFSFGTIKRDDFMVWIYKPKDESLWLISHKNILEDLKIKAQTDPVATKQVIEALRRVYEGEEPNEVLGSYAFSNMAGELPETLLKAYKWIWGQEDVNYPTGKGRAMSWEGLKKNEKDKWVKTGEGIQDILGNL